MLFSRVPRVKKNVAPRSSSASAQNTPAQGPGQPASEASQAACPEAQAPGARPLTNSADHPPAAPSFAPPPEFSLGSVALRHRDAARSLVIGHWNIRRLAAGA